MKQKGTRSPRPRFHVVFFIDPITDAKEYTALLEHLQKFFRISISKPLMRGGSSLAMPIPK